MAELNNPQAFSVAVIGGGPAGLMAAEVLSQSGVRVDVYDAMPSVGRKFLMAGKGGMNITHSEPLQSFLDRYGSRREQIKPLLAAFPPDALREWIHGLGIDTFVGSSGRVFPADMKAAPLLRAWLHRLRENGVSFHMRHRWHGWNDADELCFAMPEGELNPNNPLEPNPLQLPLDRGRASLVPPLKWVKQAIHAVDARTRGSWEGLEPNGQSGIKVKVAAQRPLPNPTPARGTPGVPAASSDPSAVPLAGEGANRVDAVVLALGGGSWPQLGSNGAWLPLLAQRGIAIAPLRPANCGFDVGWSEHFRTRFAGHPLKGVVLSFTDAAGVLHRKQGDIMVTATGIEGGLVYALSAPVRDEIAAQGAATVYLDLTPGKSLARVQAEVGHPRGSRSLSSHLQSRLGIKGVQVGLLRECVSAEDFADPLRLAQAIKMLPLKLLAPRPLVEAISSAGGVTFEALDKSLMLVALPGVFCAGEMLDWEAPTGGYLLTACFASGRVAAAGVLEWLQKNT